VIRYTSMKRCSGQLRQSLCGISRFLWNSDAPCIKTNDHHHHDHHFLYDDHHRFPHDNGNVRESNDDSKHNLEQGVNRGGVGAVVDRNIERNVEYEYDRSRINTTTTCSRTKIE